MAILKLADVKDLAERGRPWTIRIGDHVYTGRGKREQVERIRPQGPVLISFNRFRVDALDLLRKGNDYKHTPYIRMSQQSLDILNGKVSTVSTLGSVYAQIVGLVPVKDGFDALDASGSILMTLTLKGGRDLITNYNVPVRWP